MAFTTLVFFFERTIARELSKKKYFNEKKSRETRHPKMSLMARRWEVGALHQMQGMSQSAICRKTGYHHRFVKKWLKVPYTANDGEFVRSRGGVKNAQKFDEKVFFSRFYSAKWSFYQLESHRPARNS